MSEGEQMSTARQRYAWMDMLRGTAVLLVVFRHIPTTVAIFGGTMPAWTVPVSAALAPYRIPLLFFLSGMLLSHSLSKGLSRYYEGKVKALVWPYVLWVTITVLALGSPWQLANPMTWLGGPHHMWFLVVLAGCYIAGPLILRVPAWILPIPMVLLSGLPDVLTLRRLLYYGAFFFAGAAATTFVRRWQSAKPYLPAALLLIATAWGAWNATHPGERAYDIRYFAIAILGIAGILWVAPRLPRVHWLERVGRNSIVIYLAHFPLVGLAWFALRPFDLSWWVLFPVLFAVGILLPITMIPLSKTILFRWPDRSVQHAASSKG